MLDLHHRLAGRQTGLLALAILLAVCLSPLAAEPLSSIPPVPVVFMAPIVTDGGDLFTVEEAGQDVLVFNELTGLEQSTG